jgi:3-methyladenine DNA glycosylase Mpg
MTTNTLRTDYTDYGRGYLDGLREGMRIAANIVAPLEGCEKAAQLIRAVTPEHTSPTIELA